MAKQLEMMYEGKAKQVFATDDPTLAVIHYKDDATAFNGLKKGTIVGKGVVNNLVSNHLFKMLETHGIKTHLVEQLNERDSLVRRVSIVPLEVIVRNIAAGSLSKRLGLPEGTKLKTTVLEYCYKDDELGDPMVNDYHIAAMETGDEGRDGTDFHDGAQDQRSADRLSQRSGHRADRLQAGVWPFQRRQSCWRTKSRRIPAVSGTARPAKSWIRIASAAIWAMWRTRIRKSCTA